MAFVPVNPSARHAARRAVLVVVAVACLMPAGCLRRRLIVRSSPPGAAVEIDNQPIGVTPASTDYVYYGTREVKLSSPGYETLTVNQPLPTPWYALPGVDFFTEHLWPFEVEDRRELNYTLSRQRMAPAGEIIARGEQLRQQAAPRGVAPVGAPMPADPFGPQPQTAFPPPALGGPQPALTPSPTQPLTPQAPLTLGPPTFAPPTGPPSTPQAAAPFRY